MLTWVNTDLFKKDKETGLYNYNQIVLIGIMIKNDNGYYPFKIKFVDGTVLTCGLYERQEDAEKDMYDFINSRPLGNDKKINL